MKNIFIRLVPIILLVFSISCNQENLSSESNSEKIQKEIIENTGFKDYTDIFKKALSTSNHIVIKSGLYHLSEPIYLKDSVLIEGKGKVTLVKNSLYSHVFTNQNASLDFTDEWNKCITLKNITIDAKSKGTQRDAAHTTANGILSFKFIDKLVLNNIKIINGDPILYGVHIQSARNVLVKDYLYEGEKDGFHINGGCENIIIDGFDISSFDDAFGIMTDDYPRVQHNAQDIRNIVIENGISRKRNTQSGFFVRFMTGSWEDWKEGKKYKVGHTINFKNLQYKKVNQAELTSFESPNHLNGDRLYSDGIIWRYIGEGTNKTSNIYKIYISNVHLEDDRKIVRTINKDRYDYGEYPGTENTSIVDSLYIKGHRLYVYRGKMGYWEANPKNGERNYFSIAVLLLSPILFIIISVKYFQNRRKIIRNSS